MAIAARGAHCRALGSMDITGACFPFAPHSAYWYYTTDLGVSVMPLLPPPTMILVLRVVHFDPTIFIFLCIRCLFFFSLSLLCSSVSKEYPLMYWHFWFVYFF